MNLRFQPRFILFAISLIVLLSSGCPDNRGPLTIDGLVVAGKKELLSSMLLSNNIHGQNRPPVVGARVYLAQTKNEKTPLTGFETATKEDGTYQFRQLESLPPSTDEEGYYLLVVKRSGYEPLMEKIRIGVWAEYMANTVVLKKKTAD